MMALTGTVVTATFSSPSVEHDVGIHVGLQLRVRIGDFDTTCTVARFRLHLRKMKVTVPSTGRRDRRGR